MNQPSGQKAQEIYEAACLRPITEQESFVASMCGDDSKLRGTVLALLANAQSTVDAAPPEPVSPPRAAEQPGDTIGPYKLLQQIGEGGFGSVYMAEQQVPVQRRVALKIIKLGMDTKQVIARFEAERQALALMDHPNIAKVLDAGATTTGRPYFAMELVRGVPLTEYCDTHNLTVAERLELFIDVCHAIQHAHHKGIIHRDLKPSNVLVTLHDTRPVPKVIDFGIAKAVHQRLTDKTLFTEYHQFVGTPQYMSPEQAEMSGLDVDTRSDIYSLGVVLYELLAGVTPFELSTLLSGGYAEIPKVIREQDPPPLSTRFTSLGEQRTQIAKQRRTEAGQLQQLLRGELSWIVNKALEKDRARRYETASAFAADIASYLRADPVSAVPPSFGYRASKFVRRHRVGVLAGSAIGLALAIGLTVAALGFLKAKRELARSQEMTDFLSELHMSVDSSSTASRATVDQLIERCQRLFGDDHAAVGSLLFTRASVLSTSGQLQEAEQVLTRCLEFQRSSMGMDNPAVAATLQARARVLSQRNRTDEAIAAVREALAILEQQFGADSLQAAESCQQLAELLMAAGSAEQLDEIRQLLERAVAVFLTQLGDEDPRTIKLLCTQGIWLQTSGQSEAARPALERVVRIARPIGHNLGDVWLSTLNSLTLVYMTAGENELAKAAYLELMDLIRERGVSGGALVTQLLRLAVWLQSIGDDNAAEPILEEAITLAREQLPFDNEMRGLAARTLFQFLDGEDRVDEAIALLRSRLVLREQAGSRTDAGYRDDYQRLLEYLRSQGRETEAVQAETELAPPTD